MNTIAASKHVRFSEPLTEVRVDIATVETQQAHGEWNNSDKVVTIPRNVTKALSANVVIPTVRPISVEEPETQQQKTLLKKATTAVGIIILIPGTIAALSMLAVIGPPAFGLAFLTAIVGAALCWWNEK